MTPKRLSHAHDHLKPGANLGESDSNCEVRLEGQGAITGNLLLSPPKEATIQGGIGLLVPLAKEALLCKA